MKCSVCEESCGNEWCSYAEKIEELDDHTCDEEQLDKDIESGKIVPVDLREVSRKHFGKKWININHLEPKIGQHCFVKMKHGYIDGYYDGEKGFYSYKFQDLLFWGYFWMSIEEIESGFEE